MNSTHTLLTTPLLATARAIKLELACAEEARVRQPHTNQHLAPSPPTHAQVHALVQKTALCRSVTQQRRKRVNLLEAQHVVKRADKEATYKERGDWVGGGESACVRPIAARDSTLARACAVAHFGETRSIVDDVILGGLCVGEQCGGWGGLRRCVRQNSLTP
jgi:hypothetical protein